MNIWCEMWAIHVELLTLQHDVFGCSYAVISVAPFTVLFCCTLSHIFFPDVPESGRPSGTILPMRAGPMQPSLQSLRDLNFRCIKIVS